MCFSSFTPDENSQLQCDASHGNTKTESCRGQQCAQGHRGACLVSVGTLQGRLAVAVAAQTEVRVTQNRCSSHLPDLSQVSGSSGCSNPNSLVLASSACNYGCTPSCYSSLACGNSRLAPVPHLGGWKIQLSVCYGEAWSHPQALVMLCSWRCSEWDVNQDTWS